MLKVGSILINPCPKYLVLGALDTINSHQVSTSYTIS